MQASQSLITSENETVCSRTHWTHNIFSETKPARRQRVCVHRHVFSPSWKHWTLFCKCPAGSVWERFESTAFFFLQLWCFGCYDTEYSWEKCIASSVVFKLWGALYWWDTDNQWKSMTWNQWEWLWFLSLVVILNLTGTSTVNKMFFQAINFISVLVVWAISFGKDTNAWIAAELNSALLFFSTWLVFHLVSSYTVIGWLGKQQPHCWHSW